MSQKVRASDISECILSDSSQVTQMPPQPMLMCGSPWLKCDGNLLESEGGQCLGSQDSGRDFCSIDVHYGAVPVPMAMLLSGLTGEEHFI